MVAFMSWTWTRFSTAEQPNSSVCESCTTRTPFLDEATCDEAAFGELFQGTAAAPLLQVCADRRKQPELKRRRSGKEGHGVSGAGHGRAVLTNDS